MRVYKGNTGHIKNHQNFKILFWSRESKKQIFTIFPEILRAKIRNTGISSETTIPGISSETTFPAVEKALPARRCRSSRGARSGAGPATPGCAES